MLVIIAGTMTMASACAGGMVTASRPIDTVGRPRPITPLTKPASRKLAAMRIKTGSDIRSHWPICLIGTIWSQSPGHDETNVSPQPCLLCRYPLSTHSASLAVEQFQGCLVHAGVARRNDTAAVLRGLAFPGGDDAAGAGDDRYQRGDVVGFQFSLDDEIEVAGREHAIGVAVAAVAREPHG